MDATADEGEPGPDHEILDRPRDKDLSRLRGGFHSRRDVHADASDVVAPTLDLARMDARADLEAEAPNAAAHGDRAGDGAGGPIEDRQHAVPSPLQPGPVEADHLSPSELVMRVEQLAPAPIAELRGVLGRTDDVGQQYGAEEPTAIRLRRTRVAEEALDFIGDEIGMAEDQGLRRG